MELAYKHSLGRKPRRSWLVSHVNFFDLTNCNLRIARHHFETPTNGIELTK